MKPSAKYTGIPCPECGGKFRYVKSRQCVKCHILKVQKSAWEYRAKIKPNEAEIMSGVNYGDQNAISGI